MDCGSKNLHFVVIPFMQQGHMIPTFDIAVLLVRQGATVTVITTPLNAARFVPTVTRVAASGLSISVLEVQIPFEKAGLPEGCENQDMLESLESSITFFEASLLLERPITELIRVLNPKPTCVLSDATAIFSTKIAEELKIPKIVFNGFGCFNLFCQHQLRVSKVLENVKSDSDLFVLPGLPDRVEFMKSQMKPPGEGLEELGKKIGESDRASFGIIVNSFRELEKDYVDAYEKARGGKVWFVGPVSLFTRSFTSTENAERGGKSTVDQETCLRWLETQETGSVLYVCLGSVCNLPAAQLIELGLGLESSNRPFVWVIRNWGKYREVEDWISQSGFEIRVRDRGLLIRGWAPQVLILSHGSVGGFLTHCGWNSTLEGIGAGVPLLTWPLFGDQFCNEKLVSQILKIGVRIGVDKPMGWGEEEKIGLVVRKEDLRRAIEELMGESHEAEGRRRRVREFAEMAKRAVEEDGSSHRDVKNLIDDVINYSERLKLEN